MAPRRSLAWSQSASCGSRSWGCRRRLTTTSRSSITVSVFARRSRRRLSRSAPRTSRRARAPGGVGLVKLMGRHSGFIACYAALAKNDADYVLIPEVPFALGGEDGFLAHLRRTVQNRGHAAIIVAEGAGQEHLAAQSTAADASGNVRLGD